MSNKNNNNWRLIIDDSLDSFLNMAIDEALLLTCQEDKPQENFPTLRFYRWNTPTLSYGYSQKWNRAVNLDFCKKEGINIVRRLTGGRAVLHHKELTYSLVGRCQGGFFKSSILETYRNISAAIVNGLKRINVPAELVSTSLKQTTPLSVKSNKPCFFSASKYELAYKGKKMVGSAQKRLKNTFLQHGSILLELNLEQLLGATGSPMSRINTGIISLNEVLGYKIGIKELIKVLVNGFEEHFKVRLISGKLHTKEIKLAKRLCQEKYSQSWWNLER